MTLPKKFTFNHSSDKDAEGNVLYVRTVTLNEGTGHYDEDAFTDHEGNVISATTWSHVQKLLDAGYWENVQAVHVPLSLVEQLIAVAGTNLYDVTFQSNGEVAVMEFGQNPRRVIRLSNVKNALQWFGLMAQLKALEAEVS